MAAILPKRSPFVCSTCRNAQRAVQSSRPISTSATQATANQCRPRSRHARATQISSWRRNTVWRASSTAAVDAADFKDRIAHRAPKAVPQINPRGELREIQEETTAIIDGDRVPRQDELDELLKRIHEFARYLIYTEDTTSSHAADTVAEPEVRAQQAPKSPFQIARDTSSALLDDLDETAPTKPVPKKPIPSPATTFSLTFRTEAASTVAQTLYDLVRDPKVTISPRTLSTYTTTQCLLGKPEYLPEIFDDYVYKPRASSSTTFTRPLPILSFLPRNAIPLPLATLALNAAIHKRDMALAVAITDTTVGTSAHRTSRFLSKAGPKLAATAVFPLTVVTLANWVSTYQNTFDPATARDMALAGGFTYVGTFAIIAYVAVTTWSDHHDRVHWQVGGEGLGNRWLREDERMFLDKIAAAWGFEEKKRRGEETGPEWEALRDVIGVRGMVLDKTEFMEGFN